MSTRAEQVEACHHYSKGKFESLKAAAATLTRDGELRERLKKLALDMARDYEARGWADELSALLKETSDEG